MNSFFHYFALKPNSPRKLFINVVPSTVKNKQSSQKLIFDEFDKLNQQPFYKICYDLYGQKEDYKKIVHRNRMSWNVIETTTTEATSQTSNAKIVNLNLS